MQILTLFLSLFLYFSSFPFVLFSPRVSYFFSFCLFSPCVVLCASSASAFPLPSFVSPEFYSGFLSYVHSPIFYADKKAEKGRKKRARVSTHPKCLHIGIILIVYVIQKSCAKILLFYEICKYFNK